MGIHLTATAVLILPSDVLPTYKHKLGNNQFEKRDSIQIHCLTSWETTIGLNSCYLALVFFLAKGACQL